MSTKRHPAKPRGRRPSVENFDVREHLLDTATRLFSERGIAATTIAQIAAAAGVTSALVHYYFTNREILLDAIVEERLAPSIGFVWDAVTGDSNADPFVMTSELVSRLFDVTHRMPWLPPLWFREVVNEGGMLRERMITRIPFDSIKRFGARVVRAQQTGAVNPGLDGPLLFSSIVALAMLPQAIAKLLQSVPGFPAIESETLQRHVTALLLNGLTPPGKRAAAARPRAAHP
ncbi:TetR/AcrR family transcriptional regulator [Burkholderia humptydooensis]|uniref:TetR/AcrR family transcriptional regulator n=1 Tax=Burkholderia humptydooensis TaxID=430531 RepID=A0A7U4SV72_9BURK|nr:MULTISPECIES: TetR/AcrR family transcriptional regulator [Burkholderia]AJY39732.1 bacterial regulatory s, tetR family protein [Burkholderia sp. 2002721687]ALX45985.1 TetR family transcriptional regulator [Burkholderia humptydooensis]QPS47479.1 TetR/AcrR family transcriptional regulator [Burkholderia humptydooensis]